VCHVLIIEDEPFIAMILQDLLEEEGATSIAIAVTEQEAIASALACRPAVITSDVNLLEGTGPRAVQKIHEKLGEVPVIFVTATPNDCRPCNPPGVILTKPVDQRALIRAFHELGPF
jgi:CheY-like chemotaxis protein